MNEDLALLLAYCLVGFFGDGTLQLIGNNIGGLQGYFRQHGIGESMCTAAGMLTVFFIIYRFVLRLPVNWYYIAIYAIILDLIFRQFRIFPSLDGYYNHLNYFWSAIWAVIPMLLPLIILYGIDHLSN